MKKNQLISFIITIAAAVGIISQTSHVFAEKVTIATPETQIESDVENEDQTETTYTGTCGITTTWTYDTETETLTISGKGTVEAYTDKTPGWLNLSVPYTAKHVVIEEGITRIGEGFCESCFGNVSGVMTIEVSESVKEMNLQALLDNENIYFYGKTNSWFEYEVCTIHKITRFVSTGNASVKYVPTSGIYTDGATWSYDSSTKTLTIDGDGMITYEEFEEYFGLSAKRVVFGMNVVPPERRALNNAVNAFLRDIIANYRSQGGPEVCIYHNSMMAAEYETLVAYYLEKTGPTDAAVRKAYSATYLDDENNRALMGDINLDTKINLTDVILLNKAVNESVDFSDVQKNIADCNGDGIVTIADGTVLLRFLLQLVDELPIVENT